LAAALFAAGHREPRVVVWQRAWPAAMLALMLLAAAAAWLYLEGLPRAAEWVAARLPPNLERHMGDQTLAAIDRGIYGPSKLSWAEQQAIDAQLLAFEAKAGIAPTRRLEFRSAKAGSGINAFSLPGDTIIVLDGLVPFTGRDEEMLLAVLAHEAGHQAHHHMTRSLFRALGGAALAGLLWGDYSSVASNTAVVFGHLNYSRDDEREADDFAIAALHRAGISPAALARFFLKLKKLPAARDAAIPEWASTHPDSEARASRALAAAAAYDEAASAPASGPQR
ncbi:MAG: M48 family metallopeptidase, partial [Pseudomonadota bacterium]|nr:M48 family metallopeptidase [Pseudomonadota bacterium]